VTDASRTWYVAASEPKQDHYHAHCNFDILVARGSPMTSYDVLTAHMIIGSCPSACMLSRHSTGSVPENICFSCKYRLVIINEAVMFDCEATASALSSNEIRQNDMRCESGLLHPPQGSVTERAATFQCYYVQHGQNERNSLLSGPRSYFLSSKVEIKNML
jgi:hypothetical protein